MDNPGRLTKTGLLYEGNYDEWESRLWDTLQFLGVDINAPFGKLENGSPVIASDSPFGDKRIHPVTRVSREVRCETLALAWADVNVEFKPSVDTISRRRYNDSRFGSKFANRFHQLEDFEQSNRISRALPVDATIPITDKRQTRTCEFLHLTIPPVSSDGARIDHRISDRSFQLTLSALYKIQRHLDLATRFFGSSGSSNAMVVMALLCAPSLWRGLNCEPDPVPGNKPRRGPLLISRYHMVKLADRESITIS